MYLNMNCMIDQISSLLTRFQARKSEYRQNKARVRSKMNDVTEQFADLKQGVGSRNNELMKLLQEDTVKKTQNIINHVEVIGDETQTKTAHAMSMVKDRVAALSANFTGAVEESKEILESQVCDSEQQCGKFMTTINTHVYNAVCPSSDGAIGTKIARLWLGPDLIVIPLEVDYCTQVLTNQLQKSKQYQVYDSLISEGFLFTQDLPNWRSMRKVISSNFHFSIVKSYISIFYDEVNILIDKMEKYVDSGEAFQFEPMVVLATFNMVMRSTLGLLLTPLQRSWAIGTKIARLWLGPDLIVIPLEVDYCTQVLTNQLQKSKQYQVYDSLISEGFLFTQDLPNWRSMRKVISSNFHFSIVKSYISIFYDELGQLRMYWFFLKNNFIYKLSGFQAEQTKITEFFATYLLGIITVYLMFLYMWSRRRLYKMSMDLPGPIALPIIGNGYYFLNGLEGVFLTITTLYKAWR
ncbi:uncharacterized protein LOC103515942 [Diaphorina citri]|uniref:Uncharacterized protein LOC103515942 n=1 Tax=Diaphorina citri TaxID=121845 RepID=A0A1S4EJJ3_DIACI|nr:uncharacterized protein LOC103515942 [Diaphorina citri]